MTATKQQISTVLKKAIRGEKDGWHFYDELAKRATNAAAIRKLKGLRDDEIRHEKTLIAMYYKYVGGELGRLPAKGINALGQVFRRSQSRERNSEMDYLNLAIEAELATTKYYREEGEKAADAKFKRIFARLADEEHGHFELLQAEKDAISGNYHWFSYGIGAPMED